MKENHKERYRLLWRIGRLYKVACQVHEEAWEMLDEIMEKRLAKHLPEDPSSTMKMWRLREEAKQIGEEMVLRDVVYRSR
ncbi:TnpV protein [Eubacterium uniforme]|nr:TnpV protein [Eubacterium uniforme]